MKEFTHYTRKEPHVISSIFKKIHEYENLHY